MAEVVIEAIDDLAPDRENPRDIDKTASAGLRYSLEEFGDLSGITFNRRTGELVAGHQRVTQLREAGAEIRGSQIVLGEHTFPIRIVDWSKDKQRRANIAANNQKLAGHFNPLLKDYLAKIRETTDDEQWAILRFDDLVKAEKVQLDPVEAHEVEAPEPPKNPISKLGDRWMLGDHILLVGDSTQDTAKVAENCSIDLVVTDPPYGVEHVGKTKDALTIQNDGADDLAELLAGSLRSAWAASKPGAPWYVFAPPGPTFLDFAKELTDLKIWRQTLVWLKDTLVLGRSDYHSKHEAVFYGWKEGAAHREPPDRKQTTVWEFERPKASKHHPTMKPIGLVAHCLKMSSERGAFVLDPFGGSGSTLIACEQFSRRCRTIEIDPRYADVIVQRWEELTGGSAQR